jgi:hypothetical protein
MNQNTPQCAHCGRTSEEVPLIEMKYKQQASWICPQHLPVLIHKPQNLVGKLPGAEKLTPEGHGH